jgi:predicted O-methyltransferase YrrM
VSISQLEWSDKGLTLDGTRFNVADWPGAEPDPGEFVVLKPRWMIERYIELIGKLKPRAIFEMGIYVGGSVAFLALLARPDRHVATDLRQNSSAQFEAWLASHDDVVRPYYGVDQADTTALRTIMAEEFPSTSLDLVIDDASHLLEPTRSSFNVLFPALRPGGVYVIEDWAADLGYEREVVQDPDLAARIHEEIADRAPLTRLVFEIVLASAYTDLIEDVQLRENWLSVTRGPERVDAGDFDIRKCHLSLGAKLLSE